MAFLPHPLRAMLCPCSSYQQKTTNTPTLNGGDGGGVRILLLSEVTLFKYNVSTLLSPIVGPPKFIKMTQKKRGPNLWLPMQASPLLPIKVCHSVFKERLVKLQSFFEKAPSFVVHGQICISVQNFPKIVPISQHDVIIRGGTKDCCDPVIIQSLPADPPLSVYEHGAKALLKMVEKKGGNYTVLNLLIHRKLLKTEFAHSP